MRLCGQSIDNAIRKMLSTLTYIKSKTKGAVALK